MSVTDAFNKLIALEARAVARGQSLHDRVQGLVKRAQAETEAVNRFAEDCEVL